MAKKYIAMFAGRCPDKDPEPVFAFPMGKYNKDKLCSLFLSECRTRILAEERQATDVQLDLYGENAGLVMRCVARLGGMHKLEFELREARGVAPMGEMPVQLPRYRNTRSFGWNGWDIVYHGEEYPSPPERYAQRLDAFFAGNAETEHEGL